MTEAVTLAQDKLEELRATRWESIPEGTTIDRVNGVDGHSVCSTLGCCNHRRP